MLFLSILFMGDDGRLFDYFFNWKKRTHFPNDTTVRKTEQMKREQMKREMKPYLSEVFSTCKFSVHVDMSWFCIGFKRGGS